MNYICSEFHHYTYGTMSEITTNSGVQLWQLTSESGRGMVTGTSTGPLRTTMAYDLGGRVTSRIARRGRVSVYSSSYQHDPYTGNMTRRSCGGLTELFTFDNLNRLTGNGTDEYDFDDLGNVTVRGGAGELDYGSTAPYATTFLTPETGSQVPLRSQHIHYNALQRPDTIAEGGVTATFSYRADGSRATMAIDSVGGLLWQRTYRDRMEECYRLSGFNQPVRKMLWLAGTAYDAPAVLVRDDGYSPWVLHRVLRDNLGSIVVVTDSAGFVEQRLSYDAWGALRDPDTGVTYAPGAAPEPMLLGRGFTGHEHLTWCGLVNMNARLYDPALGRFLSPDPKVQQPEGTQGFNRYSYCLNNPLRYVDLDGEKIINGYGDPKLLQAKLDFLLFSRDQTPEGISKENINNEITKLTHTLKDAIETQNMIDDYKMTDPVGFKMIDNITYTDFSGNPHHLDVVVKNSGNLFARGGYNIYYFDSNLGIIKGDAVEVFVEFGFKHLGILAHEFGHVYSLAYNPNVYYETYKLHPDNNCQDRNCNYLLSSGALLFQYRYFLYNRINFKNRYGY